MPFSIGDWAIEVETDFVFQVTGVSGKGRKSLVFAGSDKTLYQSDCTPWYAPQDDYEDVRRMIAVAQTDAEATEVHRICQQCFIGADKMAFWQSLSTAQKDKMKRFAAIVQKNLTVVAIAA